MRCLPSRYVARCYFSFLYLCKLFASDQNPTQFIPFPLTKFSGTHCQNEPGYPALCVDCTCGACDAGHNTCCSYNGQNNCKANSKAQNTECNLQNGFFSCKCESIELIYLTVKSPADRLAHFSSLPSTLLSMCSFGWSWQYLQRR